MTDRPVIRPATDGDADSIWRIFHAVVSAGDTYSFAPDTDRAGALDLMMEQPLATYVAEVDGEVAGCFYIKPNQPGLGAHVCNAGFMVAPDVQRRGLGRAMGAFALEEAKRLGFSAMIFNFVVATNTGAIALWESFGFEILGTVPGAFNHARLGPTDTHVMFRRL
jgi:ribosomal protein S18 acetylase RimI-like enzyme